MTTILKRCSTAFSERNELTSPFDHDWIELCVAAVLEQLADEIQALLRDEAAAAMPEPIEPHPSLTPAQHNPNLR